MRMVSSKTWIASENEEHGRFYCGACVLNIVLSFGRTAFWIFRPLNQLKLSRDDVYLRTSTWLKSMTWAKRRRAVVMGAGGETSRQYRGGGKNEERALGARTVLKPQLDQNIPPIF